ncbi:hypothetical protein DL546_007620 [Coniochaeta pulveracea]|uniref:Uncharacterized protein n=1 Tax=Coniochaeta pulveracea TaxID=177199 RepID=A0A420YA58_9PEZI|nr:hypothetical protein DL546_007620 [Coniochaeta pulveracea]
MKWKRYCIAHLNLAGRSSMQYDDIAVATLILLGRRVTHIELVSPIGPNAVIFQDTQARKLSKALGWDIAGYY